MASGLIRIGKEVNMSHMKLLSLYSYEGGREKPRKHRSEQPTLTPDISQALSKHRHVACAVSE
jgi:hypothetical protein